jgi:hypothetical protein
VSLIRSTAIVALSLSSLPALASSTIYWTDWISSSVVDGRFVAVGQITTPTSTVGVTYSNDRGVGFFQTGASGQTDWWTGGTGATSPYTSSVVANRPTGNDIIGLQFAGPQRLQFSEAIATPVFAFVSLNSNGYAFDRNFDLLSLGGVDGKACGWWGCGGASKEVVDLGGGVSEYQLNANGVGGTEPHGALRFNGAFSTVAWRSTTNEYWNGFTVGIEGTAIEILPPTSTVPSPTPLAMLGAGLLSWLLLARRRFIGGR